MILENENTFLGGLMFDFKRIAGTLVGVMACTAFLGLLIAPMLEPIICADLLDKAAGGGTISEIYSSRKSLRRIRIFLWTISIISWIILNLILVGYNLSKY